MLRFLLRLRPETPAMNKTTFLFFILLAPALLWSQDAARYTVSFESNWSQEAHPHSSGSLPASAHWSRLVGVTHNSDVQFLSMGTLATPGIEDVAELGSNAAFFNEVDVAIAANTANQSLNGPDLDTPLGTMEITSIETTTEFPLITLVSMIAPSPDWMIAVNSISLVDSEGDWIEEIVLDLYPYDAGTDSGPDYTSPNMDTDPQDLISSLQGVSPFSSEPIGTLTISLETILSVDDNRAQQISLNPNPAIDIFRIEAPNSAITEVEIYSAIGQRVKHMRLTGVQEANVEISDLKSGIYLVRLTTAENKTLVRKLVKQ